MARAESVPTFAMVDGNGNAPAQKKSRFKIIYAGGAGATQASGQRIDQDQTLKVMAFTGAFREAEQADLSERV